LNLNDEDHVSSDGEPVQQRFCYERDLY